MRALYEKYNPFRDPAWRFHRVVYLVGDARHPRRPSRKYDDQHVHEYRKFLLRWAEIRDANERINLFPRYPALFYAHHWYHFPDSEWRSLLEARILTGDSPEGIAARIGTLPESVDWYEKLFYDVRDRLGCRDYVIKTLLGTPEEREANREGSLTTHQRSVVYKLFGYFGGPLVLDAMLAGLSEKSLPRSRDEVNGWLDDAMASCLRRRATMAARTLEVNRYNVMQLLELHVRLIEKQAEAGSEPQTEFYQHIKQAVGGLQWLLGKPGQKKQSKLVRQYQLTAVEPRADEFAALAAGEEPAVLRQTATLALPAPRRT